MQLDALMRTSLAVASHRSLDDVLATIVDSLAGEASTALSRIWLVRAGDRCDGCEARLECRDQTRCLHLRASAGQALDGGQRRRGLEGRAARIPLGARKVGQVAESGLAAYLRVEPGAQWLADPDWARRERIVAFAGHPLRFRDDVLGVLAVFSRRELSTQQRSWLQLFSDQAAVAIAHAQAFEEVERLGRQLSLDNEALRQRMDAGVAWLAAGVSHEINSPLGALLASADTLATGLTRLANESRPERAAELARRLQALGGGIQASARRIDSIVRELAGFSQLERAERRAVCPNEGLEATVGRIRQSLPDAVELACDYGELPAVPCQPRALNQLYLSLLQNAVEAVGQAGRIVVTTRCEGSEVVVAVADDGPGIDPDVLPRVFDLGYTTRKPHVGRGVGLSLARHVAAQHDGTVEISSSPGRTCVQLRLPITAR